MLHGNVQVSRGAQKQTSSELYHTQCIPKHWGMSMLHSTSSNIFLYVQFISNLWGLSFFSHLEKWESLIYDFIFFLRSVHSCDCSSACMQQSIKLVSWTCTLSHSTLPHGILNESQKYHCQQLGIIFCQFFINFAIWYCCLYTLKLQKAVKQQSHTCQIQVTEYPASFPHSCTFQNAAKQMKRDYWAKEPSVRDGRKWSKFCL